MTCVRASRVHGSLGFFSASSRSLSGSGSTRAAACLRSSSVVAFQFAFAASLNSLRIALYCSAGATGLSWAAAIDRLRTKAKVPPTVRPMGVSSVREKLRHHRRVRAVHESHHQSERMEVSPLVLQRLLNLPDDRVIGRLRLA